METKVQNKFISLSNQDFVRTHFVASGQCSGSGPHFGRAQHRTHIGQSAAASTARTRWRGARGVMR